MPVKPAMIIGQAQSAHWKEKPFPRSKLWGWFEHIGFDHETILRLCDFEALVNHGTPKGKKGRVPPTGVQIKQYRPQLLANIAKLQPKLLVPVGGLAVKDALGAGELADVVGQRFVTRPFGAAALAETIIIPLPHPSGVSLWLNSAHNRLLLEDALRLLQTELRQLA